MQEIRDDAKGERTETISLSDDNCADGWDGLKVIADTTKDSKMIGEVVGVIENKRIWR